MHYHTVLVTAVWSRETPLQRTCGGRPPVGSSPARSQGATHGLALPVSRAQVEQLRVCPIRTAMSPNTAAGRLLWTHRPPSRRPGRTERPAPSGQGLLARCCPEHPPAEPSYPRLAGAARTAAAMSHAPTQASVKIQRLHECGLCARAPKDGDFYGPKNEKPVSSSGRKSQVKSLISETEFAIYKYTETWPMRRWIGRCGFNKTTLLKGQRPTSD